MKIYHNAIRTYDAITTESKPTEIRILEITYSVAAVNGSCSVVRRLNVEQAMILTSYRLHTI